MRSDQVVGRTAAALVAAALMLCSPASDTHAAENAPAAHGGSAPADQIAQRRGGRQGTSNVRSGSTRTRLTLYGQVNRALLRVNDGSDSGVFFVDNDNSSTRVGLKGDGSASRNFSVGGVIEFEILSDSSRSVSLPSSSGSLGGAAFNDRRLEVYGRHNRFGTVWLGQGHTASDGTAESDLTKTEVVTRSDIPRLAGGIRFGGSGPRIRDVYSNMDGLGTDGRDDRIRYDSPAFGGFRGSASYLTGGDYDLAVRFRGRLDRTEVAAAAALADASETTTNNLEQYVASASARWREGVSVAIAVGKRSITGSRDPVFYYGKVAYETRIVDVGMTSFAADFGSAQDVAVNEDDFYSYGVFVVQRLDRAASDLYVGIRNHQLNRMGASFDDILAVMFGARVKF